jgi:pyruvate/2-oxoacid:ferredoxin oxidoreductase alpha subunit
MVQSRMMDGNEAAAYAAMLARVQVVPAYPITPQTELISYIAQFISEGQMKAEYLKVEGEHTAMAAAIGASAAGARVFTASCSQGIVYMEEPLWMPPGMRLPINMCIVNRALAPLGSLRPDHNDSMLQRDTGWIQLYCDNSQEVLDTILMGYKVAENKEIYLPVASCYDGYFVSATASKVDIPEQKDVDAFLPPYKHEMYSLIPGQSKEPKERGSVAKQRYELQRVQEQALKIIEQTDNQFGKLFGRTYGGLVEEYNMEKCDAVLLTMGSLTGTAKDVIDELQSEGKKIGLIKLKCFRPFPIEKIRDIAKRVKCIGVVDRNTSFGSAGGGIVATDLARALYDLKDRPLIADFHVGLAGTDVTMRQCRYMAEKTLEYAENGKVSEPVDWVELKDLGPVM